MRIRCRRLPEQLCSSTALMSLHTIGGDDTNTTAADLAAYLRSTLPPDRRGLPKTIDNDVVPTCQSLGAWTAAEEVSILPERYR